MTDAVIIGVIMAIPMLVGMLFPLWHSYQHISLATNQLEDQLERLVISVQDLDLDFDMGKLMAEDYALQRKMLIGRGVSVLLKLQESRRQPTIADDELEQLILAYKQGEFKG